MEKAKIADRKPIKVELKKGEENYWCACGLSKSQPYCDGSHKTTSFTPKKFVAEETGDAYLCMCKQTKNPPYCDGTHAKLPKENISTETVNVDSSSDESTYEEPTLAYIKELAKMDYPRQDTMGRWGLWVFLYQNFPNGRIFRF